MKKILLLISVICIAVLSVHAQARSHMPDDNDTLQLNPPAELKIPDLQELLSLPGDSLKGLKDDARRLDSSALADALPHVGRINRNQDNMPIANPGSYWEMPIMVPDPSVKYKLLIKKIPGWKKPRP